jgi:2-phospho-L-lactate/phosphoenolpyruvate guanylyltransferase
MILVPVKNLAHAKQRLAPLLDASARTKLAQAMLFDVLETIAACSNRPKVGLVTSDSFAIDAARHFQFEVIADHSNRSETDAIDMATKLCESRGLDHTLVIPGDIPLIQTNELEMIFQAAPSQGCVLVPSADGRGTNAVWRGPAGLFPLRFGNDSFKPHLAAARATKKPCVVLSLPGIALDVDCPSDLQQLAAAPGDTRAQRLARKWELLDLALAANQ